jgi:hypothetical protein
VRQLRRLFAFVFPGWSLRAKCVVWTNGSTEHVFVRRSKKYLAPNGELFNDSLRFLLPRIQTRREAQATVIRFIDTETLEQF